MLQAGRWRVRFSMRLLGYFSLTQSFQLHYVPGVDSASNKNEYQGSSWGREARKADNLTAICGPTVQKNVGGSTSHNPMGLHGPLQG
jgi:hypothetical protein